MLCKQAHFPHVDVQMCGVKARQHSSQMYHMVANAICELPNCRQLFCSTAGKMTTIISGCYTAAATGNLVNAVASLNQKHTIDF